jgi:transcriptional regulator with XRE-family HTH domain
VGWGWLVTRIRERIGVNQEQFSKKIGVHPVTVSEWENDRQAPKFEQLEKMVGLVRPTLTMKQCFMLPEDRKRNSDLHDALDKLLADDSRKDEVERYIRLQVQDLRGPRRAAGEH